MKGCFMIFSCLGKLSYQTAIPDQRGNLTCLAKRASPIAESNSKAITGYIMNQNFQLAVFLIPDDSNSAF
jgi:hypothetical protein